jgi:3-hydroxyisobutyrate dehydrogenase-like beta-hydroxyacid dehydrogenase
MGRAVAARLLESGYDVVVFNRTAGRTTELAGVGARIAASPLDAAVQGGIVVSALTDEAAVRRVCEDGLLASLEGGVHLCLSTLAPDAAASLAKLHEDAAVRYVSMPVQGRPAMAESGQLVAWISGPPLPAEARAVVSALCHRAIDLGSDVRHAAAAKLALNLLLNANIELFAEALAYVAARGVEPQAFGRALTETAFAAPLFRAIVAGLGRADDTAAGSDVRVSRKDLGPLTGDACGIELPVSRALELVYARAEESGWGHLDPIAVRRIFVKAGPA